MLQIHEGIISRVSSAASGCTTPVSVTAMRACLLVCWSVFPCRGGNNHTSNDKHFSHFIFHFFFCASPRCLTAQPLFSFFFCRVISPFETFQQSFTPEVLKCDGSTCSRWGGEKNSTFDTGGAARRVSGGCECDGGAMCKHGHIIIMCKYRAFAQQQVPQMGVIQNRLEKNTG